MDEQEQAQQALMAMFRRDQAKKEAHPPRPPRRLLSESAVRWMVGITLAILVLAPVAFIVIYPRFGPVDTMTAFCNAEGDGEYAAAYALLSKRVQQHLSLDRFTNASQSAQLISCSPNHGIPFIFGGSQASLDVSFRIVYSDNAVDGSMTFAHENGGWRVDSMTPDLFGLSS